MENNFEFTYPLFYRFLYRYGNVITTLVLLSYAAPITFIYSGETFQLIALVVIALLIFFINKYFFRLYRMTPYRIVVHDTHIEADRFFLHAQKRIMIPFETIIKLGGGVFEGRINGLMRVWYKEDESIVFFARLKNCKEFQTALLAKVPKTVYDEVLRSLGLLKDAAVPDSENKPDNQKKSP